jgi:protein LSM14
MPFGGAPPGWHAGGPGQGFQPMQSQHQFSPPPNQSGSNQQNPQQPIQGPRDGQQTSQTATGAAPLGDEKLSEQPKMVEADGAPKAPDPKAPAAISKKAPTPPVESKPTVAAALAGPSASSKSNQASKGFSGINPPTGPKGRVQPAVPLPSSASKSNAPTASTTAQGNQTTNVTTSAAQSYQNQTQQATAAVAAAMAKLKVQQQSKSESENAAVDNLTKKVAEMRADDKVRHSKTPGTGGYAARHRGERGERGGLRHFQQHHAAKVEVPQTDFDFESANAKFNKQDLVKEAIASGSPLGETPTPNNIAEVSATNGDNANEEVIIPAAAPALYNRSTSFFDNISSDLKDRDDNKRGQEFRHEERKKNLETFGQGSVDSYRGGFRGRGRGGFRGRGRGFPRGRGRGGFHAQRGANAGPAATAANAA